MPCLPEVMSPTSSTCQTVVLELANLFDVTNRFVFSEGTVVADDWILKILNSYLLIRCKFLEKVRCSLSSMSHRWFLLTHRLSMIVALISIHPSDDIGTSIHQWRMEILKIYSSAKRCVTDWLHLKRTTHQLLHCCVLCLYDSTFCVGKVFVLNLALKITWTPKASFSLANIPLVRCCIIPFFFLLSKVSVCITLCTGNLVIN